MERKDIELGKTMKSPLCPLCKRKMTLTKLRGEFVFLCRKHNLFVRLDEIRE